MPKRGARSGRRRTTTRVSAASRGGTQKSRQSTLLFGGVGVAVIAVVAVVVVFLAGGGGPASAADFSITMYQGVDKVGGAREVNLSRLHGKPLVLNFWAALCPPCRAEMPAFQQFYDQFEDEVGLIGVDIAQFVNFGDRSHSEAENLLKELGLTYPAGFTTDGSVVRKYGVTAMPTTVFIKSNGEIFEKRTGLLTFNEMASMASALLAADLEP